uniref:TPR_REGION domain-containing protein n=1 Tax=Rhabditophanes sp. KR3021 TaxID=114890 RepID=A0AC35U9U5_9BILA
MSDNGLDPFYYACLYFRFNQIQLCLEKCDLVLQQSPLDQAAWSLKLACLAEEVLVDELENEEIGLAEMYMNENIIAQNARPGTSFSRPKTSTDGNDQLIRPRTAGGRPITGVVRPLTMGKASQMEKTLKSSRTAKTSRPISSSSIRQIRQGTASMIASSDGPFLNLARLNIDKYAADNHVNRYLFDYVFYTIGDMKSAHQIAAVATKANNFEDWFWKNQLGKCYYRLNMYKDAEKQFLSSLKNKKHIETFAYLAKVYSRLDQPNTAFEILNEGIFFFDQNVTLMLHKARIEEQMENMDKSIAIYKDILKLDANNIEAIACIATTLFYNDQPEIALGYYRRILQMGVNTPALYMNLGICCFASQQIDLCFPCIEKALAQAPDNEKADFWYNTG